MEDEKVGAADVGSARVWVVLDKRVTRGDGWVEVPLLPTVASTRTESIALYDGNTAREWVTGGGYAIDKRNGYVRCVPATLTIEQPKSKSRARTS